MNQFTLAMHPASEGDALMLTWGDDRKVRRALVDLGRIKNYRAMQPRLAADGPYELFVVTHIDADHIEGVVPLFKEAELPFEARRIWFNARRQLELALERLPHGQRVPMGAAQAEKVSAGIVASEWPWNVDFESRVVSVDSPNGARSLLIDGGLTLTLVSPDDENLARLLPVWDRELKKAKLRTVDPEEVDRAVAGRVLMGRPDVERLASEQFNEDEAAPNGSSIAFVAEFEGRRVLMGADSHPSVVEASLRRLGASEKNRYKLHCLKVSHHGSKANTSPSLLGIIDCTCFAFSTDGSRHGHPDRELIARLLKADPARPKTLIFNFRQDSALIWNDPELMQRWNYKCVFPPVGAEGIEFEIGDRKGCRTRIRR